MNFPSSPKLRSLSPRVGQWVLILSCITLYSLLLVNGSVEWGIREDFLHILKNPSYQHFLMWMYLCSLMSLLLGLLMTDATCWVALILVLVPLEFSKSFFSLPAFSPLDYMSAIAIVALGLRRGPIVLWHEVQKIFGTWALWFWIGFFVYCIVAARLFGGTARGPFRWVGFLFMYFLSAEVMIEEPSWPIRLCAILAWMGTAVALHGLYQFWRNPTYLAIQGLMNQHNAFSAYLSLCLPAAAAYLKLRSKVPRSIRWMMVLFMTTAFILSYSRGAWIGLGVGVLLTAFIHPAILPDRNGLSPWGLSAILLGLAVLVAVVIHQPAGRGVLSSSGRFMYQRVAVRIIRIHPWRGLGPGNYPRLIRSYLTQELEILHYEVGRDNRPTGFWLDLHNLYLQYLVNFGLLGTFLWAGGFGYFILLAYRGLRTSASIPSFSVIPFFFISIIGFLVHNLFDIITVNSFEFLFAVLLAACRFSYSMKQEV